MSGNDTAADAYIMAKAIRNCELMDRRQKREVLEEMIIFLHKRYQFFDARRFINIGLDSFPKGWPDKIDKVYKEEND